MNKESYIKLMIQHIVFCFSIAKPDYGNNSNLFWSVGMSDILDYTIPGNPFTSGS